MKLDLEIDGQTITVEFTTTNGTATLTHAGHEYTAEVSEPEPGLFTVILNQRVYRCAAEPQAAEVMVNGRRIAASARDRRRLRAGAGAGADAGGRATLTAPMPGKVVRVHCAVGDEVQAQQGVFVVEAMKMQNEVQTPRAGKLVELRAVEGQTVNAGEVLAIVE